MLIELYLKERKETIVPIGDTGVGKTTMIKIATEGSGAITSVSNLESTSDYFNLYQLKPDFTIDGIEFTLSGKFKKISILDTVGQANKFGTKEFIGNLSGLYGKNKRVLLVADGEETLESLIDENKWFNIFNLARINRTSIYLSKGYLNGIIDDNFFDGNYEKIYNIGLRKLINKLNNAGVTTEFVFVGDMLVPQEDGFGSELYLIYANGRELEPVEVSPSTAFVLSEIYSKLDSSSREKIDNILNKYVKGN